MKCPNCMSYQTKVIRTKDINGNQKRRYQCANCDYRFDTIERAVEVEGHYSIIQAAEITGMKARTIREWIRNGKIKAVKMNKWLISESEVLRIRKLKVTQSKVNINKV